MKEVVSHDEWRARRLELLKKEKEFTQQRDELSQLRRSLPWEKIEKNYQFDSKHGKVSLADIFDGRSQLIVYHFMFAPDWEEGCKSCSFLADQFENNILHLNQRDVSFVCISNAPLEKLFSFQKRMGWTFPWVSSLNSDFNYDFQVSNREGEEGEYNFKKVPAGPAAERPGVSVFVKDNDGLIYRSYSNYARGLEDFITAYRYLDIVPKGRDEDDLPYGMSWVKFRDQYNKNRQNSLDIL